MKQNFKLWQEFHEMKMEKVITIYFINSEESEDHHREICISQNMQ
jgi:hypothetical protein